MPTKSRMDKQAVTVGPFSGGMNTYSDPAAIGDNEIVDCVNFDVSLDGTLVSRPPIKSITNETEDWTQRIWLIGSARISGTTYVFGSNTNGTWILESGAWTLMTSLVNFSAALQYNNVVYLLPFPNNTTYALCKWTPTGGFSDVSPSNLKTMMGGTSYGGSNLAIYNGRLFITPGPAKTDNASRLIFSDAGAPETYTASTQFVDVSPGDGQNLIDMAVQDDNLLLFKSESSWVFTFTSSPADAELIKINDVVGVTTYRSVEQYENAIYIMYRDKVYEIVNYNFQCINVKVPFVIDTSAPEGFSRLQNSYLSRIGDRLIARWFNRLYVYGLRTKTWTRWNSADDSLRNIGHIVKYISPTEVRYYAGSILDDDVHTFQIGDGWTSTDTESIDSTDVDIECSIRTKSYDLGDPYHYKRLYWWGVDATTINDITGSVNITVALFTPTWGDIMEQGTLWSEMTIWSAQSDNTLVETTHEIAHTNMLRGYFRFPKSLRFRQAHFIVDMTTDGSTLTGPARIFALTIVASSREVVPKGVN